MEQEGRAEPEIDGDGESRLLGRGDCTGVLHRQRAGGGGGCRSGAAGTEKAAAGDRRSGGSGDEAEDGIRGVEHDSELLSLGVFRKIPRAATCRCRCRLQACVPRSGVRARARRKSGRQGCDGRAELSYSTLKDKDAGIGRRRGSAVGARDLGAEVASACPLPCTTG